MLINLSRAILLIALCGLIHGCANGRAQEEKKNIILLIGDGMGTEHRKAARWITMGDTGKLAMGDMPVEGTLRTGSADNLITDSAAAATAMATGVKTNNGVIGLNSDLSYVTTILEKAKIRGKSVGLVTTTHLTHATPAAFAAHTESRNSMSEIAKQMLIAGVDVLLGGGEDEFIPTSTNGCYPEPGERTDGRNLIDEAIATGYVFVCTQKEFNLVEPRSTFQLLGVFSDEGMTRPFSPSLQDMTKTAIDILNNNPEGFFLMVEGGQIDWASHANDAGNAITDTIDFDSAVKLAKQFAAIEKNTLVIVTADHETGGMEVSLTSSGLPSEDGPFVMPDGRQFYVNWSTFGHTADNVPLTSLGPDSEMLLGVHDNTIIHDVILSTF
jgi:alkaline phosphatase